MSSASILERLERRLRGPGAACRRWPVLTTVTGVTALVAAVIFLLGPASRWLTPLAGVAPEDQSAALNATRQVLLAGVSRSSTAA